MLYLERHGIENLFARLKVFRRIASRYEKLHITLASMITIAWLFLWLSP